MEYSKLEYYVSQPRLDRFLQATGNSKSKAQKLYRINLRTSQAFYPILNLFEIVLRNIINYQISGYFANPNWIITEKNGFMDDNSLRRSRFYLKNSIQKAERTIRRMGGTVTAGKVIAEQSLGFWTSLFDPHHYRLIGGVVIHCFPNKPAQVNRSILNQKLNNIREFRNRVYHNEPICFNGNNIDFREAISIKEEIYELFEWIEPDLVDYVEYFNGIEAKINSANGL
ncbi:hypothetical protein [uncultured Christiangramia sp.]|uniref:hypothetical protein n=1 Tax=uncultured Christiangramia sp. TaxID=503836 RepID=UPI00260557AE|nr:hypothetical protein [uncultured Christiangramia sp.]